MNVAALATPHEAPCWPAALKLALAGGARGTRLRDVQHTGPLYVQKPFYPEGKDCAHLYLLHPPGGIVSGDSLQIDVIARDNAQVLLTTPGAARAYRARDASARQRQSVQLTAETQSSIEYFPLETIVHDGARLELRTHIALQAGCSLSLWDIVCLGLPASGGHFSRGRLQQKFEIIGDGKPVFVDRLVINSDNRLAAARCGLNNNPVSGFFLCGPFAKDQAGSILEAARHCIEQLGASELLALTYVNTFCVARYLGNSAAQARRLFIALWAVTRPALLACEPSIPRIWYT